MAKLFADTPNVIIGQAEKSGKSWTGVFDRCVFEITISPAQKDFKGAFVSDYLTLYFSLNTGSNSNIIYIFSPSSLFSFSAQKACFMNF